MGKIGTFASSNFLYHLYLLKIILIAKGFVAELAPPHVQSAWRSSGKKIQVVGLTACCNYL